MINFVSRLERDENEDKLADRLQKCIGLKKLYYWVICFISFLTLKNYSKKFPHKKSEFQSKILKRHLTIFWMP